ncbi:hypothetical protein NKJ64_18120 [Mesorhizobium sp. M0062]|uniref:hypothetical protein n=1 Tax=Mesorhizobium sp. M0062 TaxID=2956867 RepID=UPI003339006F
MRRRSSIAGALVALLVGSLSSETVARARQCPASLDQIVITQSLIVTLLDWPNLFSKTDFSFAHTIDSILASLKVDPDANRIGFVQTLLDTYDIDQQNNPDSMLPMAIEKQRNNDIPSADMLLDASSGLQPVALVNRFDRAPRDGANCGEYRIVYAMKYRLRTGGLGRFFLNFEAVLPNPERERGIAGCMPVAEFWSGLSGKSEEQMAADLEKFYYEGLGSGFVAAVLAKNYGIPDGQVRGNANLNGAEHWQLREWKIVPPSKTSGSAFRIETVKNNALAEFYRDDSKGAINEKAQEQQRIDYQRAFVDQNLHQLFSPELTSSPAPGDDPAITAYMLGLLNDFGAAIDNRFNEFQSISSNSEDDPELEASGLKPRIDAALSQLGLSSKGVSSDEALARAGAITCGGCHAFSNGKTVGHVAGREIRWPNSLGFVHIDENGNTSPALREWNLPWRRQKLYEMLCTEPKLPEPGFEEELVLRNELAELLTALIEKKTSLDGQKTDNRFRSLVDRLTSIDLEKGGYFVRYRRTH